MLRWLPLGVLVMLSAACSSKAVDTANGEEQRDTEPRWTYEDTRDEPPGPGLLSGSDGAFTLDDLR